MARESLSDLLLDELKDGYDAEHQIVVALPKMIKAASSPQLKQAFQSHLEQTKEHIARLEEAFELLGEKASRKTCKGMKGLIAEGEDLIKDHSASPLLDAGLIGAAQRIEHYEIAAYGTSRAYAEAVGKQNVAELLQETLDEEKETDQALTVLGMEINQEAVPETAAAKSSPNKTSKN